MTQLTGNLTTQMGFAVYGTAKEFQGHAGRVYSLIKGWGCRAYPLARDGEEVAGDKCCHSLAELPQPVDLVVVATGKKLAPAVVAEAAGAGVKRLWFQNFNASKEALALCQKHGLEITRGCALRHMAHRGWRRFLSPCYWHGRGATKPLASGSPAQHRH